LVAGGLLGLPSFAAAGAPYTVNLCEPGAGHDGITFGSTLGTRGLENVDECGNLGSSLKGIEQRPVGGEASGAVSWMLNAPAGTEIKTLQAQRKAGAWDTTDLLWQAARGSTPIERIETTVAVANKHVEYHVNGKNFTASLVCTGGFPCFPASPPSFFTRVSLTEMVATMEDTAAPSVSIDPAASSAPLRETARIPFAAADIGSGVKEVELRVDGSKQAVIADSNGGRCTSPPFRFLTPCKPELDSSASFDSLQFPDGPHEVKLTVTDASGQTAQATATITLQNAPTALEAPKIGGEAKVGSTLSLVAGKWRGPSLSYEFQWLRCDAGVKAGVEAGCGPISGATGDRYVPTVGDVGQRDVVRVIATNAAGSAVALSAPSGIVVDQPKGGIGGVGGPVLSKASLSRARFRVAGRRPLKTRKKGPRGSVIRFSSNEAATLSIVVSRAKGSPKPLGALTRKIAAGAGHVAFSGRLGRKRLRPGRYRLTLTAADAAGLTSPPVVLPFRILAG
jgi:hypothetical protein